MKTHDRQEFWRNRSSSIVVPVAFLQLCWLRTLSSPQSQSVFLISLLFFFSRSKDWQPLRTCFCSCRPILQFSCRARTRTFIGLPSFQANLKPLIYIDFLSFSIKAQVSVNLDNRAVCNWVSFLGLFWFSLATLCDWLKNSHHFLNKWEVKPNQTCNCPARTCFHEFGTGGVLNMLNFSLTSDWFVVFMSVVTGQSDCFSLGFYNTPIKIPVMRQLII